MTLKEFNRVIDTLATKDGKRFSVTKAKALANEVKSKLVYFIVRNRHPIVVELIPKGFDMAWLGCMGYLYRTKGKRYTFVHTCEHTIK